MKKTAFLKKLSAIILSVVMLLSVLGGTISVSAEDTATDTETTGPVNILAGNTTGTLYRVNLTEPYVQKQDFVKKTYDNLNTCAASGDFVAWGQDLKDVDTDENLNEFLAYNTLGVTQASLLNALTTKDNTTKVRIDHTSGGDISLNYRAGILYDLGGQYNLDSIKLTQDISESIYLYNFSVYAGNALDATIFENEIGNGGGTTAELSADLENNKSVRYVLIMFDHSTQSYNYFVNGFGYKPTLTQIEIYGEEVKNILEDNTSGTLYRVNLTEPYTHKQDFVKKTYDNLNACAASGDFVAWGQDLKDVDTDENLNEYLAYNTLGVTQASLLNALTTKDNTTKVRIDHTSGGDISLNYRAGILYDLGGQYNLDSIKLTQEISESIYLYNFSVYAGNALDATIFENEIGNGGGTTAELSADLENNKSVRYVLIMFDHSTQSYNYFVNGFGYKPTLTQIKIYATSVESILWGNNTAKLYYTTLATELNNGDTFTGGTYDNLTASVANSTGFGTKIPDVNDYNSNGDTTEYLWAGGAYGIAGITDTDTLAKLTTKDNTTPVKIESLNGGTAPNARRVGILYDLGARYNLDTVVLTQAFVDDRELYNFSVYAGNTVDATIFNNCIGRGGDPTKTDMVVELDSQNSARYILIMLDNMSQTGLANQFTYYAYFTSVQLFGENTNLIAGNSGAIYKTTFTEAPYTQGQDFVKKTYTTLEACAANGDYVSYVQDVNDVDSDGNVTEYLTYSALGLTQEDVLACLTTPGNTTKVRFDHTSGGNPTLTSRVGLLYDLGAEYNLDTLVLGQDISENLFVFNFSVYAGNALDATIFNNQIGSGGGTDKEMTVALDNTVSARYVIIMIDHSTQSYNNFINLYGYKPTLTAVNIYGEKAEEPVEEVYGDMNADEEVNIIDYILLTKAIPGDVEIASEIADLNGDGAVDGDDLIVIKKILLGIEVTPPTEDEAAEPNLDSQGSDGTEAF